MGPLALRALVGAYVSGELDRAGFRSGLSEAVRRLSDQSGRAVALVRALAFELDSQPPAGTPRQDKVVTGLIHELLEALPLSDAVPQREEILAVLQQNRSRLLQDSGLDLIGLAGSIARSKASAFSDVDVAARWVGRPGSWDQFGIVEACRQQLAARLRRPVDLVIVDELKTHLRDSFLRDMIALPDTAHAA